jgi:hypothetical protein
LNNFAASNGITLSIKNPSTIVFVKRRIKALVARISLGETGYFYVLNNTDQACNAAVASLNN